MASAAKAFFCRALPFFSVVLIALVDGAVADESAPPGTVANEVTNAKLLGEPQWTTSSRLLKLGETIQFRFYVPARTEAGKLEVFPRFLESTDPDVEFDPHDDSKPWLRELESEQVSLRIENGSALIAYQPKAPGNYLARWQVNGETLYRYFAVVEDDWVVIRFSTYYALTPHPSLHGVGLPLDYRPPAIASMEYERQYETVDEPADKVLYDVNRRFGDSIIPSLPSTCGKTTEERLATYRPTIDKVREDYADHSSSRSARIQWGFDDFKPHQYHEALERLGINDNCGMWVGNATPWRGMPEFPFFTSAADDRAADQSGNSAVVAHQWDFTASWHFLGPVSWHSQASRGDCGVARKCLTQGIAEFANLAEMSGHPAFVVGPLYDGTEYFSHPRSREAHTWVSPEQREKFVKKYVRFFAFEAPREHKVAFARSIDVVDYYLRHYKRTPRTIFSCRTDHVHYDIGWLPSWCGEMQVSFIQEIVPWFSRPSGLRHIHKHGAGNEFYKDPLSYEYLLIEDHERSIRFERNSPNPVWWFEYTQLQHQPNGLIAQTIFPDVFVEDAYKRAQWQEQGITDTQIVTTADSMPFWRRRAESLWIKLKLVVEEGKEDEANKVKDKARKYAVCLWNIPQEFAADPRLERIQTNADDFILAKNTEGEYHLVLFCTVPQQGMLEVKIENASKDAEGADVSE